MTWWKSETDVDNCVESVEKVTWKTCFYDR